MWFFIWLGKLVCGDLQAELKENIQDRLVWRRRVDLSLNLMLLWWSVGTMLFGDLKGKEIQKRGYICIRTTSFPGGASGKEPTCQCRRLKRCKFGPWVWKIPWRRAWQPTAVFLPGESHGQRSLEGYSPWGCRVGHSWSDLAAAAATYIYIPSFFGFLSYLGHHRALSRFPCAIQ